MNKKKFTNTSDDTTISNYFKDVRKSELITPEEEVTLAIRIENGDNSNLYIKLNKK